MYRTLLPVAEITPNTKSWTAKILVMRKLSPRQSQSSPKKYQRFLFIDKDQTQVQAIIYSPDMSLMENVLQVQETYFISNAKVTFVEPKYRMVSHMYQWIINRTTVIRHGTDDSLPRELGTPQFTKFEDIPLFLNTNTLIDILAIVIDKLEQRTLTTKYGLSTVQEFIIVNDERKPMRLTLWNEIISTEGTSILNTSDKMPIIEATRLNVSDFQGVSLSAKGFANIVVNPSYPETQSLRSWRAKNHLFLIELVNEKKYLKRAVPRSQIPHDNFSSVASVITNNVDDKFWIKVKGSIVDVNQKFWYMACDSCFKGTIAQYEWNITCSFCHAETIAKPRCKFTITLADNLIQLDVMIFGELGENVLGLTALELMKLEEENKIINSDAINEQLNGKELIVQIKKKMTETHYGMEYRYTVSSLVEAEQASKQTNAQEISSSFVSTVDVAAETFNNTQVQSSTDDPHQTT